MNQMQGGGSRVMSFGKARARVVTKDEPKTDDVVAALVERETIEKDELVLLMGGLVKRPPRHGGEIGTGVAVARRSVNRPDPGPPRPIS